MNGESSVHIDRGHWLYRFALDAGNIAIYRARRAGQSLAPAEVWRCLAVLGISDVFIVAVPGSCQPFIELGDGRHRLGPGEAGHAGGGSGRSPPLPGLAGRRHQQRRSGPGARAKKTLRPRP